MMEVQPLSIKFVGTGGAFEVAYGNSSAIIQHNGMQILLDCGHAVFPRLVQKGLVDQIDGIIITHLHDDHVGSLSSMILYYNLVLQRGRIKLYVPNDTMRELIRGFLRYSLGDPEARVDLRPLSELVGVGYVDTFGRHVPGMQTFAYYFSNGQESILYSGDNGDANFLLASIAPLDLPRLRVFHEIFFHFRMHSHAYYQDLMALQPGYEIYGYHCDPAFAPADNTIPLVAQVPELNY